MNPLLAARDSSPCERKFLSAAAVHPPPHENLAMTGARPGDGARQFTVSKDSGQDEGLGFPFA